MLKDYENMTHEVHEWIAWAMETWDIKEFTGSIVRAEDKL